MFQILKEVLKQAKTLKNSKNKLQFFLFRRFYKRRKNVFKIIAFFMLIFLDLKSKPRYLFWGVASSLSVLCAHKNTLITDSPIGQPYWEYLFYSLIGECYWRDLLDSLIVLTYSTSL